MLNNIGQWDVFLVDSDGLKNAVKTRINKIKEEQRYNDTIKASVDRFQWKIVAEVASLKKCNDEMETQVKRDEDEIELCIWLSMEKYFNDHRESRAN